MIALWAAAFSPNLMAHGRLATTDIYLAAAVVATFWSLDRWLCRPGLGQAALLGICVGLATLCKFTGTLLLGFVPAIVAGMWLLSRWQWVAADEQIRFHPRMLRDLAWALGVSILVINLGYAGHRTLTPLGGFHFDSGLFAAAQAWLPRQTPVPLPYHFVAGFDAQLAEKGYDAYLCGTFNQTGFWNYYFVAFLVKSSLAGLVAVASATVLKPRISLREVPLLVFVIGSFALFSFVGHKNIGLRYLLFAIPLACVWMGRISVAPWSASPSGSKTVAFGLLAAAGSLLVTHALIWPDYLAYFNLAAGGPDRGHEYLLDSNLDWGQDLVALREFIDRKQIESIDLAYFGRVPPEIYGIRYTHFLPDSQFVLRNRNRYVAISANLLWGRMYFVNGTDYWPEGRGLYAPFRQLRPVAVLGHSIYVFDMWQGDVSP
jgi:hypothetical protein